MFLVKMVNSVYFNALLKELINGIRRGAEGEGRCMSDCVFKSGIKHPVEGFSCALLSNPEGSSGDGKVLTDFSVVRSDLFEYILLNDIRFEMMGNSKIIA